MEKTNFTKRMRIILLFITFTAYMVAQGQQLKTFHHFQGRNDLEGLTYTGYEDEIGNITRHGRFTYKKGTRSATLNYKNGKIDGEALYTDTKTGMVCKIKYKDGRWSEIYFKQDKYERYKYNDDTYGKLSHGPIILKCSRTESGLPTGDFELTFIKPYEHFSIKGKFDLTGKATGKWITEGYKPGANFTYCKFDWGDTAFFDQGYCVGKDDMTARYGREFLIEKKITEQELLNKGFFFDNNALKVHSGICNDVDDGIGTYSMQKMLSLNLSAIRRHIYYSTLDVSDKITTVGDITNGNYVLGDLDDIDFSNAFIDGVLIGTPINFMSIDLYQKLKNDPSQFKYDQNLKKYFVFKTDGRTKLYVPLDLEEEFNQFMTKKKQLELENEKEKVSTKATTMLKNKLDAMVKTNSYDEQLYFLNKFRPVYKYSIEETSVSNSLDKCMITIVLSTKVKSKQPGYFESYKTNVIINKDSYNNWIIDSKQSFVKKEQVDNIWDSIANIKNNVDSLDKQLLSYSKECPTVISSYKKENISLKNKESDPKIQYEYYLKTFNVQKAYLRFIDLVKQINRISDRIVLEAKEESDIVKSYQSIIKNWNLSVNNNIFLEVKRLEDADYYDIQDSCLTFIALRKLITQNNAKIAGYTKTAPTIVKAYNTYMKGVDLTWNQESGRNQAIREIIQMQIELIYALQRPDINEIDKTVKNSKAKTWEEVKKIVL